MTAGLAAVVGVLATAALAAAQPSISHDPEDPPKAPANRPTDPTPPVGGGRPVSVTKSPDLNANPAERAAADPASAAKAPDPRPVAAVLAATADALDRLREQVLESNLGGDLSVGRAVEQLRAEDAVRRAIQSADQRGAPRWFDVGRCEVRLELSGAAVADAIESAARSRRDDADLSPRRLSAALDRLRRQTFSATGVGTADDASDGRPAPTRGTGAAGRPAAAPPPPVPPAAARPAPPPSGGPARGFAPPGLAPPRLPRWPVEAPAWADDPMTATGRADGSGLRGARSAESVAVDLLRRRVEDLRLADGLTVGQACRADPALDRAVADALASAAVDSTLYERQQVTVRVSIELRTVWRRMSAARSNPSAGAR